MLHGFKVSNRSKKLPEKYGTKLKKIHLSGIFSDLPSVSHQWCDLFYRLLHSYTRHIERVVRGERDTLRSAQE